MKVKEVAALMINACETAPLAQTCDQLMAGDWDSDVTGIVSTFMATVDVIRDTISKGANLIITHEPTYYTGHDQTDWLAGDQVYLLKQQLILENKINIWRFHDHMHMAGQTKFIMASTKNWAGKSIVFPRNRIVTSFQQPQWSSSLLFSKQDWM